MNIRALLLNDNFHKAMVCLGVLGSLISIIMGWGGMFFLIRIIVKKMLRLVPGTITWNMWKTIPLPVYLKFYVFNISNAEELTHGANAIVNEMGPYTYLIDYDKHNFIPNESNDTYSYQDSKTYHFVPELSKGREDDLVTYINFIYLGVSHIAHASTEANFPFDALDVMLAEKGEKLYRTDKVKDLFFDGISIKPYTELLADPLFAQQAGNVNLPDDFKDGKYAIYKGKNGTQDAWWEVHTGTRDYTEFGQLASYQNKTKLTYHKHYTCNAINGSDGTLYPPFIEPAATTDLYIYVPELCRSVKWQYEQETVTQGIPVSRYHFPDIQTPYENPDMWCFCPHNDLEKCNIHGLASLESCYQGFPLMHSKPHFLDVDPKIQMLVKGTDPNKNKHEGFLDIHAFTGITVEASVTRQLSIELINWPKMPSFANATRAYIPFVWIEQSASLDTLNTLLIGALSTFMGLWPFLRWLNLFGCLGLVGIGGLLVFSDKQKESEAIALTIAKNDENEQDDSDTDAAGVVNRQNQESNKIWIKKFVKN